LARILTGLPDIVEQEEGDLRLWQCVRYRLRRSFFDDDDELRHLLVDVSQAVAQVGAAQIRQMECLNKILERLKDVPVIATSSIDSR